MRRVEVQENNEDGEFIVQWYRDGQRLGILFVIQPVCREIVDRLIGDAGDKLWTDVAPEVLKAEVDAIVARVAEDRVWTTSPPVGSELI